MSLRRWFAKLRGRVVRRLWCERASAPVYSRYLQTLVDVLVASKERLVKCEDFDVVGALKLDSTVPDLLPRPYMGIDDHVVTDDWLVFRGSFSVASIDNPVIEKVKQRGKGIRGLMDGGDGPPLLDVGMTVLRGEDWNDEDYGLEDGWEEKKGGGGAASVQEDEGGESEKDREEEEVEDVVGEILPTVGVGGEGNSSVDDDNTDNVSTTSMGDVSATSVGGVADDDNSTTSTLTAATTETESSKRKKQKAERKRRKKEKRAAKAAKKETLPLGEVVEICDYKGVKGAGRKVKWAKTGVERVYR